jgi:hypothetical protein
LVTGDARFSFAMTIGLTPRVQSANVPLVGSSEQLRHALSMDDVAPATIVSRSTTCQLFVTPDVSVIVSKQRVGRGVELPQHRAGGAVDLICADDERGA